ncbi:testisin-like [Culicoides brevitarsis]|uniref:testisin-like n=1 Tax=Culicoides brevitarsis TaxID=469753 RepID=UPI00307C58EB
MALIFLIFAFFPSIFGQSIRSPCPEIFQYGKEFSKDVGLLDIAVPKIQIYEFNVTLVFFVPENVSLKEDSVNITLKGNASEIVRKVLNGRRVSYVVYFEDEALQLSEIYFSRKKICELDEDEQPSGQYKIVTAFKTFKAEIDVVAEYNRIFNIGISEGKCGHFEQNIVEFSIGGERAIKLNWPWVASMYVKGDHVCSATLIDKSVAITASHCLEPNGFPAAIKDIELVIFSNETVKIWLFVKHPYHQGPGKNDIALLFLEHPISNALFVPVCLWEFYEDIENRPGTIVGFGETEFTDSGDINSLKLMAVSSETCAKSHEKLASLVNSQTFCAGGQDGTGPYN